MSCLSNVDAGIQKLLRMKITSDIVSNAEKNIPVTLDKYVQDMYEYFKKEGASEDLALDAARVTPIIMDQVLSVLSAKETVGELVKKANPKLRRDVLDLIDDFEASVDKVREKLGLTESNTEALKQAQLRVNQGQKKDEPVNTPPITDAATISSGFRSVGIETLSYTDPKAADYLIPNSKQPRNFAVQRAINTALREQMSSKGISSSAEMELPGIAGGIYTKVLSLAKAYSLYGKDMAAINPAYIDKGGLVFIITDSAGNPIKFSEDGKVDPAGKVAYYRMADDLKRTADGKIDTSKAHKQIEDLIKSKTPAGQKLNKEEREELRKQAIAELNDQYDLLNDMRKYLAEKSQGFITATITGAARGFINTNPWKPTPLSQVNWQGGFKPIVITKEQSAESGLVEGNTYVEYPGVDDKLPIVRTPIMNQQEVLTTVVSLFSDPLYTEVSGKLVPMDAKQRVALINQYMSNLTAGVEFLAKETTPGTPAYLSSDGSYTVSIKGKEGEVKYKITYNDTAESKALQSKLAEALLNHFTTPQLTTAGNEIYNSKTKVAEAEKLGANFVKSTTPNALNNASSATIYGQEKSKDSKGNAEYDYYRVDFPVMNVNSSLVNGEYNHVTFQTVGDKKVAVLEKRPYNKFVEENFSTTAVPSADKIIRQLNPFLVVSPTVADSVKFMAAPVVEETAKTETPETIHESYKGKIIWATPGSGKSTLASEIEGVIDTDELLLAELGKQYPDFPINRNLHPGKNLYAMFAYINSRGGKPEAIYDAVRSQMKELAAEGKTILTGSLRFKDLADIAFLQENPEILKNRPGYPYQKEAAAMKEAGVKVVPIKSYMKNVLQVAPEEVKEVKAEPEVKVEDKTSNAPATQKNAADDSEDDIIKAMLNKKKFLEKNAAVKAAEQRSTVEQLAVAKAWYQTILAKNPNFPPFHVLFAAINAQSPGPAATWAVNGITLFHYYSEDGKFDQSKSGDFTDLYHEAWHAFTQTFLTQAKREAMYAEARKKTGSFVDYKGNLVTFKNATAWQLEEFLAEDFRKFMMSGGKVKSASTPVKNSIFQQILDFLKGLFKGVNTEEGIYNPLGIPMIQEMYQQMSVGNLSSYNFDVQNRDQTIGELQHAMLSLDPDNPVTELGYDDANVLVGTVDSLISEFVNKLITASKEQDGRGVYSYTSQLMQDAEDAKSAYNYAKRALEKRILPALLAKAEAEENGFKKEQLLQNAKLVQYAIDNFGDLEDLSNNKDDKGVIAYHKKKSKYLSIEDKDYMFDDIDETKATIKAMEAFDRAGNETSQNELAPASVNALMRSIHKFDELGKPAMNRLGVQELTDYHLVWNKLARILGQPISKQKMYEKMQEAAITDPHIREVINKLGPPKTKTTAETSLWIDFWQTFNMAEIKLIQMNIRSAEDKPDTYHVTIGSSHTHSDKAGNVWRNSFRALEGNFLKKERDANNPNFGSNALDLSAIIGKYSDPKTGRFTGSKFEFFNDIGIRLSRHHKIIQGVETGNIGNAPRMLSRIKAMVNQRDMTKIYSLDELFDELSSKSDAAPALGDEQTNFNALQELETRYSDIMSNYMVTNAAGNTQFEQSLNNSITVMLSSINEAPTYADLIALPWMKHLDITTNPLAPYLSLNSLFDLDNYDPQDPTKPGTKRTKSNEDLTPITINITNLSGAQLIDDAGDQGIESAKADEFTKLILDFHLTTMTGRPELMRHADKGTSFSVWISKLNSSDKDGKMYIRNGEFAESNAGTPDSFVAGFNEAANMLLRYVDGELKRINKLKEMAKEKNLNYDANYLKEGQKFVIFEDILSEKTQQALLKMQSLYNYDTGKKVPVDNQLILDIKSEITQYFEKQTTEVKGLMNKAEFMSEGLVLKTKIEGQIKSKQEAKDALIRSFVVNSWMHNIETMGLIYGDLAQYNIKKEEFHKRNAGAGSTGTLFATDIDSIEYVNNKGRLYAKSLGKAEKKLNSDGSYDSAIFEDSVVVSKYYPQILEAQLQSSKKKYQKRLDQAKTKEERAAIEEIINKEAKSAAAPYNIEEEGNAQGWTTFDFYRATSILNGKWSPKQENMYVDICNGKKIDPATAKEFFPVRKYQYWGPLKVEEGQLPINAFHKFSLLPLIPGLIEDTNLEELHKKMIDQGIDYATFKSGSKVSTITEIKDGQSISDKFYTDSATHTFNQDDADKTGNKFTKNTVFLQFLKNQLEVAPYYKGTVTFPTQMRKLIENGMMEGGVPTDFAMDKELSDREAEWNKLDEDQKEAVSKKYRMIKEYENDIALLTKFRMKELEKETDLKRDKEGNIITDEDKNGNVILTPKLQKFLMAEMSRQDLADHEIAFVKRGPGNTLAHDLSLSLSADKLERVLNSIVVKRIIRQKFKGEGLIQVAGVGFEKALRGKLTAEEQAKYGTNGLPFYEQVKDGLTKAMKVKISLQGDFLNLLNLTHADGNVIGTRERLNEMLKNDEWLDTDNHRKMVTIIGPRIPVQGLNSMEFAEVFEFLPIEAGNIVVLPSEIVAKSGGDYDVDKLTFMYPNIKSKFKKGYWETEEGKAKLSEVREFYKDFPLVDFSDENVKALIEGTKEEITDEDKAVLHALRKNTAMDVIYDTSSTTAEGLENRILNNMRSILELEENFADLIRPNDTDIVVPIAQGLESKVSDKQYRTVEYQDKGKTKKRIAGTRVFEVGYNLYKHSSNNIGKQTLGLGAVDNTYNSIFNRIGMRLNHSYTHPNIGDKRLEILLPHNTLKDAKGNNVISMAHLKDAEGLVNISDVISQLMNGWVDIAKDAWIFNLQGNKEIAPTLLFMVQSGVPIKQAVYMVSHPLIRQYVKQQKLAQSTFAGPLGTSPGNPNFAKIQARKAILGKFIGFPSDMLQAKNATFQPFLYNETLRLTGQAEDFFSADKVEANLLDRVDAVDRHTGDKPFEYTDEDKAVFLHFLELEDMAKAVRDVKLNTNVDTNRATTLFEAENKMLALDVLKKNPIIPVEMIQKIQEGSPIQSFFVQDFQVGIWKGLFKLRNNPMLNEFLRLKMEEPKFKEEAENTWGELDKFIGQWRNDLVSFIFQNSMKSFDIDNMDFRGYKGIAINKHFTVDTLPNLEQGVYVKNDKGEFKMYMDKAQLQKNFKNLSIAGATIPGTTITTPEGKVVKVAELKAAMFTTSDSYYKFMFERELLRAMFPGKQGWKILQERADVQLKLQDYTKSMTDKSQAEIETMVYEETLRDMALDNTLNTWKMFNSNQSVADQFVELQTLYPELQKNYSLIQNLAVSINTNVNGVSRVANITLLDSLLDSDKLNVWNQNMRELSDPANIKINTDNAIERQRVAKFFEKLSTYAFLQSGMNTSGAFSLVRIVPQEKFTAMMVDPMKRFMDNINMLTLEKYHQRFLYATGKTKRRLRSRYRDYHITEYSPARDKVELKKSKDQLLQEEQQQLFRFDTDAAGNPVYYANPSTKPDGTMIKGLSQSQADGLAKNNPDKVFVMNGTTGATGGANTNEAALINSRAQAGNIIPIPVKKGFGLMNKDKMLTDVSIAQAQEQENKPVEAVDQFQYYGKMYDIKTENGVGVDVVDASKGVDKVKLLGFYNNNPNVDPQNGKAFRGEIKAAPKTTAQKEVIVPKGSNPKNLPIFETEDKVYLMNDGQQAAYDKIKSFVLARLNAKNDSKTPVVFSDPMNKEFSGIIPENMWNNMIGLVGRGGVGKTTVIKKVLEDISNESPFGVGIRYVAPTHNAVTMLQEALGFDSEGTDKVDTTAGLVSRNQTFDSDRKDPKDQGSGEDGLFLLNDEEYKKSLNFRPAISDSDIIVIDESSMVDTQFIKDLLQRFKIENRGRMPVFIYMGDYRQLPPVVTGGEKKQAFREGVVSATLFADKNKSKFAELTEVMRTDNEIFHKIFDTIGNQITEQRKDIDNNIKPKDFSLEEYDKITSKSSKNLMVVQERQIEKIIQDYAETLANTDDPYAMFWAHYNRIDHAKTQELFGKIRAAYFSKMGKPVPTGVFTIKGKKRPEIGIGDYVQYSASFVFATKSDENLNIKSGLIKPTSRFKVMDIIEGEHSLRQLNEVLGQTIKGDIMIKTKTVILYNRQGKKRVVLMPATPGAVVAKYNNQTRNQEITVTDMHGKQHTGSMSYGKWKDNMNSIMTLNDIFESKFLPSYIGSTHTVQGASIKKMIVGDYNIRQNAAIPQIAMRDIESSLYTALTRTAEKLIIIKPNGVPIENNQSEFELSTPPKGNTETTEQSAKDVATAGAVSANPADKAGAIAAAENLIRTAPSKASNVRKDIRIMNESQAFIGKVVPQTSPTYMSATEFYRMGWGASANNDFLGVESVMISGSGTWNPSKHGGKISDKNISDWFNEFYKPLIDKAISQGVQNFNVGNAAGIDALAKTYLKTKGFTAEVQDNWTKLGRPAAQAQVVEVKNKINPINGMTIAPDVKAAIDKAIQSMVDYEAQGYELAFPATGIGQYMIGADDLTGVLPENAQPVARETFLYLSRQLYDKFKYVNPNLEKVLEKGQEQNPVKADSAVTNEEVMEALSFCFKQ